MEISQECITELQELINKGIKESVADIAETMDMWVLDNVGIYMHHNKVRIAFNSGMFIDTTLKDLSYIADDDELPVIAHAFQDEANRLFKLINENESEL